MAATARTRPSRRKRAVLLAPGAGADRTHHTLVALEAALAPVPVRRMDFTYRKEGRRVPDREPKLLEALDAELATLLTDTGVPRRNVVLGGRSLGGRMCSLAVAAGTPAAGLVLLSYPLHPPGRLDRMRTAHFPDLDVPCLFVSGTKDPFGTPDEFLAATKAIPGPVTHVWLDGQRHDPRGRDDEIAAAVVAWFGSL
jgi:predicted alpha/beta-hydrolase family hydrolase